MPSSETSQLSKALVKDIEIRDLRFDLIWSFGDVLKDVPQRLGFDKALDAATNTFIAMIPLVLSGRSNDHMMRTYIDGLRAVNTTLSACKGCFTEHTWTAVYLMWICQVGMPRLHRFFWISAYPFLALVW